MVKEAGAVVQTKDQTLEDCVKIILYGKFQMYSDDSESENKVGKQIGLGYVFNEESMFV